ncbi:hypothetical protein [Paenibacillus sedimenti]|uniref:Uncharacterized protein n=1 Tax=Paenibacillus sedimenti TaxID=2770274 RepID=A0A926QJ72_9BACL|nr:hypothetical protein [Paenibacillus sedimenti]MBD0381265.1 hypothetical protein [Paenibacillus sedimenti]
MGPWLKLCEFLGGQVGRKMGRVVTGDLRRFEKIPGWTHADKIEELAGDRHVSAEYLKELIDDSQKKEHLEAIVAYLDNSRKSGNLSEDMLQRLTGRISAKLSQMEDSELLRQLLDSLKEAAKNKGATSMDYLADIMHHLV